MLDKDAKAAARFTAALRSRDSGDGKMRDWGATTISMATVAKEVQWPPSGPPAVPAGAQWALLPDIYASTRMPLTSQMLARLPPQALPPGPMPTKASELLADWAVRAIFRTADAIQKREAHFFRNPPPENASKEQLETWLNAAPDPKPKDLILGDGAFRQIRHADGVGYWRANAIIFDVSANGDVKPLDTQSVPHTQWALEALRRHFDAKGDLELLSHIFDGLRYKAHRPRQVRIATNMDSLATHVRPIAADISKLADAGKYKVRPLLYLTGALKGKTDAWPLATLPAWTAPVGAVDKKDSANEKRRISNGSWPYKGPLARDKPHGPPDGIPCESFNELAGPMRPPPTQGLSTSPFVTTEWGSPCDSCAARVLDSTEGEHSWWGRLYCCACWAQGDAIRFEPLKWHRERKHDAFVLYQAASALVALAALAQEAVYCITTDFRWWFWQFGTHPWEYWTSQFIAIVKLGEDYAVCLVGELVANMGRSPVSNVASSVGSKLFEPIRIRADAREPTLLRREPEALREALEQRSERMGPEQARLYWSGCYTDDSFTMAVGADRAAYIAADIEDINTECKVLMASLSKCPVGTLGDHIGARVIPGAGIGTITPAKRSRALVDCGGMMNGTLSCSEFEEAKGLVGHVVIILALDHSLLNGLGRQLQFAVANGHAKVKLTDWSVKALGELQQLIAATPFAAIYSALDARTTYAPPDRPPTPYLIMSSDACTGSHDEVTGQLVDERGARDPAIFVHLGSYYFRFRIQGRWRRAAITITEPLGPVIGSIVLAPLMPHVRILIQGDATTAHAFVRGRSKSAKLQQIYRRWRDIPGTTEFLERSESQHISGNANTFDDAGSRGYWDVFNAYAAACGVRMTSVPAPPGFAELMSEFLDIALAEPEGEGRAESAHPTRGCASDTPSVSEVITRMSAPWPPPTSYDEEDIRLELRIFLDAIEATAAAELARLRTAGLPTSTWHERGGRLDIDAVYVINVFLYPSAYDRSYQRWRHHSWQERRDYNRILEYGLPLPFEAFAGEVPATMRNRREPTLYQRRRARASKRRAIDRQERGKRANQRSRREHERRATLDYEVSAACYGQFGFGGEHESTGSAESEALAFRRPESRDDSWRVSRSAPVRGAASDTPSATEVIRYAQHSSPQVRLSTSSKKRKVKRETASPVATPLKPRLSPRRLSLPIAARAEASPPLSLAQAPQLARWSPAPFDTARANLTSPMAAAPVLPPNSRQQASPKLPAAVLPLHLEEQPATARALYSLAARRLAERLAEDGTPHAVCPGDPERLRALVNKVFDKNAEGRAPSTRYKDDWGYRWWVDACAALPTPAIRPTDYLDEQREAFVAAFAVMHMAGNMKARSASNDAANPNSAWDAYKRSRGVLLEWGCKLPSLAAVRKTLKGLLRSYVGQYGDAVMAPNRKKPFYKAHEDALLAILESGAVPRWSPPTNKMMGAAIRFARCCGARKAELCIDGGSHFFTRAHVTWFIGDRAVAPTPENISKATMLRVRPTASKADPFNINWGSHDMWFSLLPGERMSLALALQELELEYPCVDDQQRRHFPLFFDPSTYARGTIPPAFNRQWLTSRFELLMQRALGQDVAAERTWHSWRVTLACSLRAAIDSEHPDGRSLELVKLFGRWRSDAAVALYGRLSPTAYAAHVSASLRADSATIETKSAAAAMRAVDPVEILEHVQECADSTDDERPPARAPAASRVVREKAQGPRGGRGANSTRPPSAVTRDPPKPQGAESVMVPAHCFPNETCTENDGRGWTAYATKEGRGAARITFAHAKDAKGRCFAPIRMQRCSLRSLSEHPH